MKANKYMISKLNLDQTSSGGFVPFLNHPLMLFYRRTTPTRTHEFWITNFINPHFKSTFLCSWCCSTSCQLLRGQHSGWWWHIQETSVKRQFLNLCKFNFNSQFGQNRPPSLRCHFLHGYPRRSRISRALHRVAKTCQPCQPAGANFSQLVLIFGQSTRKNMPLCPLLILLIP